MFKIKFDMSGLKKLQKKIEKAAQPHEVRLVDMMNPAFMRKHSRFHSFEEFVTQSGVSGEQFVAMSDAEKDELVRKNTTFTAWQHMLNAAGVAQLNKELS